MFKRFTLLALVALMAVPALPAVAQTQEDALRFTQRAPATGARLMGLAGAGGAGVGDWAAVFSNPAGLGWLQTSEAVGSLNVLSTLNDATLGGATLDARANRTGLSNLGYAYKAPTVRGSFVFGVGFNQTGTFERDLFFTGQNGQNSITDFFMPLPGEFELNEDENGEIVVDFFRPISFLAFETFAIDFDQDLFDAGDAVPFLPAVTDGTVLQEGDVFETGNQNELSFGGSIEAAPKVMLGLGANLTFGTYDFDRVFFESDENNENDGFNGTTDFNSLELNENIESDIVGINLRGGLSAEVAEGVRVGLTVETPTYYTVDEGFSTRLFTEFDNGDTFSQEEFGGVEYEIVSPWRLGGGIAFANRGLLISADAELVDWSQLELRPSGDLSENFFDANNREIRRGFDQVVNTRLGAEYDFGAVALRGGYAYQPDPASTDELDRSRQFVSAGLGFNAGDQLQINVGWMRETFDDRYQPYTEVIDAPVVTEEVTRDRLSVGVRVRL
ncbi:MAG: outer membrane protein transport protein [Bacteroidota bacterium]